MDELAAALSAASLNSPSRHQPSLGDGAEAAPNAGASDGTEVRAAVVLQEACAKHRYIRNDDIETIVERPERLRAVRTGVAAAIARLATTSPSGLVSSLSSLSISAQPSPTTLFSSPINIIHSTARAPLLSHPATQFIHAFTPPSPPAKPYPDVLHAIAAESAEKIAREEVEVPDEWPQGDLYLCPDSVEAIEGAIGAVCEAVDLVVANAAARRQPPTTAQPGPDARSPPGPTRTFVAIRPPGHHCGEDAPSGFCWVNNVLISSAHAHLSHSISHIAIFDIDLHHGDGSQSITWDVNAETARKELELAARRAALSNKRKSGGGGVTSDPLAGESPGPKIFYSSMHDIESFPCEDGNPERVRNASVVLSAHGQNISNVHLDSFKSEADFYARCYPRYKDALLGRARAFLAGVPPEKALILVSAGFDACEHEGVGMSRHGKHVPVSFYETFARDASAFADELADGKLVSALEGGYSDRALSSAAFAWVTGLGADTATPTGSSQDWWTVKNLEKLEAATKRPKRRTAKPPSLPADPWVQLARDIFLSISPASEALPPPPQPRPPPPPRTMTLRDRGPKQAAGGSASLQSTPTRAASEKAAMPQTADKVLLAGRGRDRDWQAADATGWDESPLAERTASAGSTSAAAPVVLSARLAEVEEAAGLRTPTSEQVARALQVSQPAASPTPPAGPSSPDSPPLPAGPSSPDSPPLPEDGLTIRPQVSSATSESPLAARAASGQVKGIRIVGTFAKDQDEDNGRTE